MKRTIVVLSALLCIGTPGVAMAGDTTADLLQRIVQLEDRNAALTDQVEHKSDVLACERAKRRALEQALRTGEPVGSPASCR